MLSFIYYKNIERGENMNKPKDLEEVREAVQNFLKEKYGDAVLTKSGGGSKEVVILLTLIIFTKKGEWNDKRCFT